MGRERVYEVAKRIPVEELDKRVKRIEKDASVLKRLYFIRYLCREMSVEEVAGFGRSYQSDRLCMV